MKSPTPTKLVRTGELKAKIAEKLPISTVAEDLLEVDLLAAGVQMKGCCPLHKEDTPSFYVNDTKGEGGLFHCFGCKEGGDSIKLLQLARNLSFPEAVEVLAEKAGVDISDYRRPLTQEEMDAFTERQEAESWLESLKPATERVAESIATELGIVKGTGKPEGAPYPDYLFTGTVFPYRLPNGTLVGWKCRPPGPEKKHFAVPADASIYRPTLFGIQVARSKLVNGTIVVVEGEFDCAVCHEAGFTNVVATGGSSFTPAHMELLESIHVRRVILAYDGDTGGRDGAKALARRYWSTQRIEVAELPAGKDPEDILRTGIEGIIEFGEILGRARHALEWLLWEEWQSEPRDSLSEKLAFLEWVRDHYSSALDDAKNSLVAQEVAGWMGLSEAEVLDHFKGETSELYDTESERVLLARALQGHSHYLDMRTRLSVEDFYMVRHQRLWEVLQHMASEGLDFDVPTIKHMASARGVDPSYVDQVVNTGGSNHAFHEDRVLDLSVRRIAQGQADRFRKRIADVSVDSKQAIGDLTLKVTNKALGRADRGFTAITEQVDHAMETLHERMQNPNAVHGLDLGSQFPVFTQSTQGLQPGRLIMVAAAAGVGKSTLSLQWAGALAIHQSVPVDFVSLEMEEDELLFKLAAHMTGINGLAITGGALDDQQASVVEQAFARIRKSPLRIWAPDDITPSELQLFARESVLERRTEVLFLDYAQLVAPEPGMERDSDYERLGFLGRVAKMKIARGMGITVVFAAQLKRDAVEKDRPTKEDVGDSYHLARTADVFLILKEHNDSNTLDFWIDKNRQGPNNVLIPLIFDKPIQTFREAKGNPEPDYRIYP